MSHSEREVDKYLYNLDMVFKKLSKIIKNKEKKENFLEIPIIDQGFKRLT